MEQRLAVFATGFAGYGVERHQVWADYYNEYFRDFGSPVDLYIVFDGFIQLDSGHTMVDMSIRGAQTMWLSGNLGRPAHNVMPGWKRSMAHAITQLGDYSMLMHIEADFALSPKAKQYIYPKLHDPNAFAMPFCVTFGFPETACQIINSRIAREWYTSRYSTRAGQYREEPFEDELRAALAPELLFHSTRRENQHKGHHPEMLGIGQVAWEILNVHDLFDL